MLRLLRATARCSCIIGTEGIASEVDISAGIAVLANALGALLLGHSVRCVCVLAVDITCILHQISQICIRLSVLTDAAQLLESTLFFIYMQSRRKFDSGGQIEHIYGDIHTDAQLDGLERKMRIADAPFQQQNRRHCRVESYSDERDGSHNSEQSRSFCADAVAQLLHEVEHYSDRCELTENTGRAAQRKIHCKVKAEQEQRDPEDGKAAEHRDCGLLISAE